MCVFSRALHTLPRYLASRVRGANDRRQSTQQRVAMRHKQRGRRALLRMGVHRGRRWSQRQQREQSHGKSKSGGQRRNYHSFLDNKVMNTLLILDPKRFLVFDRK
jgi:hypothetical protein